MKWFSYVLTTVLGTALVAFLVLWAVHTFHKPLEFLRDRTEHTIVPWTEPERTLTYGFTVRDIDKWEVLGHGERFEDSNDFQWESRMRYNRSEYAEVMLVLTRRDPLSLIRTMRANAPEWYSDSARGAVTVREAPAGQVVSLHVRRIGSVVTRFEAVRVKGMQRTTVMVVATYNIDPDVRESRDVRRAADEIMSSLRSEPNSLLAAQKVADCLVEMGVTLYCGDTEECLRQGEEFRGASGRLSVVPCRWFSFEECTCGPFRAKSGTYACGPRHFDRLPVWDFGDGNEMTGTQPLRSLAEHAGCPWPVVQGRS